MLELEDLPLEVIEYIAHQLDASGLRSFRLTSKRYENASFKALVDVIQELRFAIAPWSLPTLLDIARHPTIAQQIHTVRLARCLLDRNRWEEEASAAAYRRRHEERGGEDADEEDDDETDEETEEELEEAEEAFLHYFDSQRELIEDGATKMLSEILCLLPNLKFVALGEWEVAAEHIGNDHLNYFQKDENNQKRISGFPTRAATEFEGAYDRADEGFKEINVVLQAFSQSQKPIEGFICRSYSLYDHFIDLDRVVEIVPPISTGLSAALENLRVLHLSLGQDDMYGSDTFIYDDPADEAYHGNGVSWLASFINLTPNLEDLLLSFNECDEDLSAFFKDFVLRAPTLSRLKNFELHFVYVNAENLVDFLARHASTLQSVKLRYCGLSNHRWSVLLPEFFKKVPEFHANVTLARLNEVTADGDNWQGSVLFDAEGLSECCNFGSDSWGHIRGKDCKHICKTVQRKDIEDLKLTVVDREDPLYKAEEERRDRLFMEAMRRSGERQRLREERERGDDELSILSVD